MKILSDKPEIYEALRTMFEVDWNKGLVITYYPNIHTKGGNLPEDLIVHESVHLLQQEKMGVDKWWDRYILDRTFRVQEETAAYIAQARFIRTNVIGRNVRRAMLKHIQGSMVRMYAGAFTREEAKAILEQ